MLDTVVTYVTSKIPDFEYVTSSAIVPSVTVGVGGKGGASGEGGEVTVTNSAALSTAGYQANGIFAQSIGGGGGIGGGSIVGGSTVSFDVGIGGSGGGTGTGGDVTINNTGAVSTGGGNSFALFGQSVGGGVGGSASNSAIATLYDWSHAWR